MQPKTFDFNRHLACTECPYVFTEAELAAEDKSAWGHPCHGVNDEPGTVCESFRQPLNVDQPTIGGMRQLLRECLPYVLSAAEAARMMDGFLPQEHSEDKLAARMFEAIGDVQAILWKESQKDKSK